MFRWIKRRREAKRDARRQDLFDRAFIKVAREKYHDGEISYQKLEECIVGASNKDGMRRARLQLTADPNMLGGIADWDWEAIYAWFVEYIIPALKVILPMLLLLGPNPTPDE